MSIKIALLLIFRYATACALVGAMIVIDRFYGQSLYYEVTRISELLQFKNERQLCVIIFDVFLSLVACADEC